MKILSAMVGPVVIVGLSLLLSGCIGAMQTRAHEPVGTAVLKPTREDKEAGLVGLASGFNLKPTTSAISCVGWSCPSPSRAGH